MAVPNDECVNQLETIRLDGDSEDLTTLHKQGLS